MPYSISWETLTLSNKSLYLCEIELVFTLWVSSVNLSSSWTMLFIKKKCISNGKKKTISYSWEFLTSNFGERRNLQPISCKCMKPFSFHVNFEQNNVKNWPLLTLKIKVYIDQFSWNQASDNRLWLKFIDFLPRTVYYYYYDYYYYYFVLLSLLLLNYL